MRVLVMAGHTLRGKGTGASKYLNESKETRRVAKKVVEYLKKLNIDATYIYLDEAKGNDYLKEQVALANTKGTFDIVIQIHFNAGSSDPNNFTTGTETYYVSAKGKVFADRVNAKLSTMFRDRGAKNTKPNLYWLKYTNNPAILIETCFVDDKDDARVYEQEFDSICKLIAEGIANKSIPKEQEGWIKDNVGWAYKENGKWCYGWKKINSSWFYLDNNGYAVTGWRKINDKWYFFDQWCYMKTGWIKDNDKWYFLDSSGAMVTGWLKENNKWYYLKSNGAMETGLLQLGNKTYFVKDNGELVTNKKIEINNDGEITFI